MQFADVRKYVKGVLMNSFTNKLVLDRLSDNGGTLQYDGKPIEGGSGISSGSSYPMVYSEEEIIVGCWTNGKPLYRKSFRGVPQLSNVITIENLDTPVSFEYWMWDASHVGCNKNPIPSYATSEGFIVATTNPAYIGSEWWGYAEYTKTTDAENSFNSGMLPATNTYSTDEKVIGTWIDGRPLYQKTFEFGQLSNGTVLDLGFSSIYEIVGKEGIVTFDDDHQWTIPAIHPAYPTQYVMDVDFGRDKKLVIWCAGWYIKKLVLTLKFVKAN